jgi:hypothetical protein
MHDISILILFYHTISSWCRWPQIEKSWQEEGFEASNERGTCANETSTRYRTIRAINIGDLY